MEIKTLELVKADGKRNVKMANAVRKQMFDKITTVLTDAGFDVAVAANGEIAIKTAIDGHTGDTYYTRLAVSLSAKDLDAKIERKVKAKETVEVEVPNLFE